MPAARRVVSLDELCGRCVEEKNSYVVSVGAELRDLAQDVGMVASADEGQLRDLASRLRSQFDECTDERCRQVVAVVFRQLLATNKALTRTRRLRSTGSALGVDAEFGVGAVDAKNPAAVLSAEVAAADVNDVPASRECQRIVPMFGFEADPDAPIIGGDVGDAGELEMLFLVPDFLATEGLNRRFQGLSSGV